uniref:TSA: Wollemia nobilis Ref_Wollemi_Transcript_5408_1869 transcribed RNA sequence n=1 Tax=Wollemia nobilis TaxID=56998 RepID=A0A0C9RXR4_9CONI
MEGNIHSQVESPWWVLALPVVMNNQAVSMKSSSAFCSTWVLCVLGLGMSMLVLLVTWLSPGGSAWGLLRRKTAIPGPRGMPLVGSLMVMCGLAHRLLATLAESHGGKRLMAFSLGFTRVVICSQPEVAKEILNSSAFADRPIKESAYQLMFDRAIGFAPYSDYWRGLRKIAATHLFSPRRISAFESHRQTLTNTMLESIEKSGISGGSVRIRELLQRTSLNNIMGSVFGRSYKFGCGDWEAEELASMVQEGYELLGTFNFGDHLPLLGFLDMQRIRKRCSDLVPRVYAFVQNIIEQHRANPAAGDRADSDFVDVLLSLEGNEKLSNSDMVAVLWEMIFRGTDTVAILMEWILARLVLHPNIQAKVHEELDSVVGNSRQLVESDIPKLPYLQAVVKEVLRIHPPGPLLSWARLAIHDVHVGGHLIPAGTTAMVNMWSITHDKDIWADPLSFRPERFLPSAGGEEVNIMGSDLRLAPFGSGRRVCPGKALGLQTVHTWLARMLHHFQWLPSDGHPVDLTEILRLSCEMKVPLCTKLLRRNNVPFQ